MRARSVKRMPKKVRVKREVRLRTYSIIETAVEMGVSIGLKRAYKHSDKRLSDAEEQAIEMHLPRAVMEALDEILDWGDPED